MSYQLQPNRKSFGKEADMSYVEIYTDGACLGNPGRGGWAYRIQYGNVCKWACGYEEYTTNNRMELVALIEALRILKRPCKVKVYSDSKYIVDSLSKGWARNWKKNGWVNSSGKVKNDDLWKYVLLMEDCHKVEYSWVKGHSGVEGNEFCDSKARIAAATGAGGGGTCTM